MAEVRYRVHIQHLRGHYPMHHVYAVLGRGQKVYLGAVQCNGPESWHVYMENGRSIGGWDAVGSKTEAVEIIKQAWERNPDIEAWTRRQRERVEAEAATAEIDQQMAELAARIREDPAASNVQELLDRHTALHRKKLGIPD